MQLRLYVNKKNSVSELVTSQLTVSILITCHFICNVIYLLNNLRLWLFDSCKCLTSGHKPQANVSLISIFTQIDLLDQGKFKKTDIFQMVDTDLNRKFRGKAFLFEYTIVLTEFVDGNEAKLQYRTHIAREKIQTIDTDNSGGFELVQENFRKTGFCGESRKAQEWIRHLRDGDGKGEPHEGTPILRHCPTLTTFSTADRSRASKFFTSSNFSRSSSRYNTAPVKRREKNRSKSQPRVVSTVSNTSSLSNKSDRSSISSREYFFIF